MWLILISNRITCTHSFVAWTLLSDSCRSAMLWRSKSRTVWWHSSQCECQKDLGRDGRWEGTGELLPAFLKDRLTLSKVAPGSSVYLQPRDWMDHFRRAVFATCWRPMWKHMQMWHESSRKSMVPSSVCRICWGQYHATSSVQTSQPLCHKVCQWVRQKDQ